MKSITDIKIRLARIVACSNSTTRETPKDHKKATGRERGFLTTDKHGSPPRLRATSGFSLVEIVIAIGVAAFCLVAMLGLIPTGLKSVRNSVTDTAATEALAAVAADLRDIQPGSNASPNYNIALPTALGLTNSTNFFLTQAAALTTSNDLSAQFGVITTLSNSTTFLTTARIQIYWPAIAPVTNAQGTVETVISFNRD